jgi:putative RecB family exonuclease
MGRVGDLPPYVAPEWLSPSACSTYLQCPQKFFYEKIEKRPTTPSDALFRGRLVHEVIERLMKMPAEKRTLDEAKNQVRMLWNKSYAKEVDEALKLGKESISEFKWDTWWCIENYFQLEDPKKVVPEGNETWVRGPIGSAKVRGVIDRYERKGDGYKIVDYKTGKKPGRPEWAEPHIFQMTIYAILLEAEKRATVEEMELLYLGDGNKSGYEVTEEGRESVIKTINSIKEGIDKSIESGDWETRTSKLCDWCDFKPECPAWQ